mgnify:CR=1 FL=1
MDRDKFEIALCDMINAECRTNFKPLECEKIDGIFIIQEDYGNKRFQRFTNFGKPCKFGKRELNHSAKACIEGVKARRSK